MEASTIVRKLSLAQYMAWEAEQPGRNEFFRGEVFAMVGGRRGNGRVVANLMRHLGHQLEGTPCQAFCENMKVQVGEDAVLYPDVFVTCADAMDPNLAAFTKPVLVVEVLSPSTQRYDRSEKFAIYRRLESLREYVLVDPDTRRVEAFRPDGKGHWTLYDMSEGGALDLESVSCTIPMSALFDGVGR
jgi:Uma2 family endonuclease